MANNPPEEGLVRAPVFPAGVLNFEPFNDYDDDEDSQSGGQNRVPLTAITRRLTSSFTLQLDPSIITIDSNGIPNKIIAELNIVSDLPTEEAAYKEALAKGHEVGELPDTVEKLTLYKFVHGFPAGYVAKIRSGLTGLKKIMILDATLNAMDLAGGVLEGLEEVDITDTMIDEGVVDAIAAVDGIESISLTYTIAITSPSLATLVTPPSLLCLCLNLVIREEDGFPEGMPLPSSASEEIVVAIEAKEGTDLLSIEVLELSMFTLELDQLERVLRVLGRGLTGLRVAVKMGPGQKEKLREAISQWCEGAPLMTVLVTVVPDMALYSAMNGDKHTTLSSVLFGETDLKALQDALPLLSSFRAQVLNKKSLGWAEWEFTDDEEDEVEDQDEDDDNMIHGKWVGGVYTGEEDKIA